MSECLCQVSTRHSVCTNSGACCTQVLYTAHVGDSGAIIDRGGTAYRLTEDHKPYMKVERQRIQEAGGQLVENGNRVLSNAKDDGRASMLAMSRYCPVHAV